MSQDRDARAERDAARADTRHDDPLQAFADLTAARTRVAELEERVDTLLSAGKELRGWAMELHYNAHDAGLVCPFCLWDAAALEVRSTDVEARRTVTPAQ